MKQFLNFLFLTIFSITTFGQNLKISELSSLTNAGVATLDVFPIVDVSANQTKKFSIGEFDLRYGFTVTAPLSKTAGASPVVSIPVATSSVDGYLSSANWSTFNNKVSLTGTEALTNKDYDGGTASNTSRLTIPKAAKTTLDALTRKQGTIVYDTTSNKPYYDNGTTLTVVGSGSGGGKNFIQDGDAEAGTTGWATFDDGAASSPVNGTGGSPSVVTWSTTATAPLESLNSFTYVKTGSDAQGEGVAYTFAIDPAYRAKVLNVSFDYILSSGTFAAGTSSDVSVWLYDVTNSQLIQPSSYRLLSNSTTTADKFQGTFQTSSSGASYRLILFSGTTSTSAYTLKIDNVSVAPSSYVFGTPVTDWQTVTITSNLTNQATLAKKRRVGDSMQYSFQTKFTGAPGAATSSWTLPDTIDSTKLAQGAVSTVDSRGACNIFDASTSTTYVGSVAAATTTTVQVFVHGTTAALSNSVPVSFANNDYIECSFMVPISGLSSSVQMSDQTDTRVVSFRAYKSGGNQNGTSGVVSFTSVEDTHGGFDLSAGTYTVKVPGDYQCGMNNEWASAQTATFIFRVNGSGKGTYSSTASSNYSANSHLIRNLVVGDSLSISSSTGSSLTLLDLWFYCSRISGPNQIAASEVVSAFKSYTTAPGGTVNGSYNNVIFATTDGNTHGAYNTSTGDFTCPVSGQYLGTGGIGINASFTSGQQVIIRFGNTTTGVHYYGAYTATGSVTTTPDVRTSGIVDCKAGEVLAFQAYSSASTPTYSGAAAGSSFSIVKVK
jgi:hypothetical protein